MRVLLLIVVALAALLAVNAVVVSNETKSAETTVAGGEILRLGGGDVQVTDEGPRRGQPIVLLHCYGCSLRWWDAMAPLLAKRHRVIRIDLLGFGGSEKPSGGYAMPEQAALVAEALARLEVNGAVVVGHSMGFSVATALAEEHSELVDRLVNLDEAPDSSYGDAPFLAKLGYVPVIGQALRRVVPDFAVEDSYAEAFAPGFDMESGFEDPDQVIADYEAMTYTSYDEASDANRDFGDEIPLDARVRSAHVPLLVVFGEEDQFQDDPVAAAEAYADVPGAEIAMIEGAGHSPNVEQPEETAALVLEFAADAGDERSRLPRRIGLKRRR